MGKSHFFDDKVLGVEHWAWWLWALGGDATHTIRLAPDAPSDAPKDTSPRQGLEDDSSLEHDCLAGTGWAREREDDEA
jgi:hypothetical protein